MLKIEKLAIIVLDIFADEKNKFKIDQKIYSCNEIHLLRNIQYIVN